MTNIFASKLTGRHRQRRGGFTLPELLVTCAVFSLALTGALYGHLFGLKMASIVRSKVAASDQARIACGRLMADIRSAKIVRIGEGSLSGFTPCPDGSAQQGNAIQIQPSTNTAQFIRYFLDSADRKLKRTTNGTATTDVVAEYITNNVVFTSEDFRGTNLTASQNNRVIGLRMQFYQIQYPVTLIGPSNYYDFYQLQTKITRRTLE
jgi:prepilin-type N-terminal cleavage/methylation domain-containing protein